MSFRVTKSKKKITDSEGFELIDNTHEVTLYNNVVCKYIYSERWNLYFESLYGVNPDFEITPRSQPYFTPLDCRRHLNILLQPLFPERPVVVDLTCGIGGDLADFILNWNAKQYLAVDNMDDKEFAILYSNMKKIVDVKEFENFFPGGSQKWIKIANKSGGDGSEWEANISLHQKTASKFLKDYGAHLKLEEKKKREAGGIYSPPRILVYADPTWNAPRLINATYQELVDEQGHRHSEKNKATEDAISENESTQPETVSDDTDDLLENEGTPDIIMDYIIKCILLPMRKAEIPCNIFCVKVRWDITQHKMQEYLNKYKELKDHFVVLYSVQAIANVPGTKLHAEEDEGNFKYVIYDEHGKTKRKKENFGAVKGIFHWIVMQRIDYMYVPHERTPLYEEECIRSKPVFVDEKSFIKPFQPRYSDHLPFPTIKTKKEFDKLLPDEKKMYRKIGPAKTWEEVKLIDVETYITELKKLQGEYDRGDDNVKADINEKIGKILILCEEYVNGESNLEIAKTELQKEIANKIIELKGIAESLQFTTVTRRRGTQTSKGSAQQGRNGGKQVRGGAGNLKRQSGYDERLELLHQLQVIFET